MLTHAQARRIASEWHTGQNDPLYAFVSTGRVTENTIDGVDGLVIDADFVLEDDRAKHGEPHPEYEQNRTDLAALRTYLAHNVGQASTAAWHRLWSTEPATDADR
jgi:hypothetical protein